MPHATLPLRRTLLATLVAALAHGSVLAEEMQLPAITVAAPPLADAPMTGSSVVDGATLQKMRPATSDTATLLQDVPGLNIQSAGGVSGLPVVHGLADDRLRIKVDGMDLISACGNHMNPPLSYIDPNQVGTASVVAGITPVSQGGDSIGSTIIIDSPAPEFAESGAGMLHKGEIGTFYRSNGNAHGANLAATLASESLSVNYRGATAEASDYEAGGNFKPAGLAAAGRGWLDGDEVGSTMYRSTNHSLSLAKRLENHQVELKLGMQDIPYQGFPNQRMDMTGNDSTQLNLGYAGEYGWGDLEARAYQEHTRHKMQFGDDKLYWYGSQDPTSPGYYLDGVPCTPTASPNAQQGCAAGMPMDTEGYNSGVVVKAEIPLSQRDLLRLGSEGQQYRFDDWWDPAGKGMWPNTFLSINDGERDRFALFAEWEAQWSAQWLTQLGLRGEQVKMDSGKVQGYNAGYLAEATAFNNADRDTTDNNLDLTLLTRFTPDNTRSIELGYARKTRSPNLYERFAWSTNGMAMRMINWTGDGNGYVGNLALNPEIAHTVSATFDWHDASGSRWGFKATPYYTYVQDYIDARRCGPSDTLVAMGAVCNASNLTATNSFVYLKFVNQAARLYGLDISGNAPLAESTGFGDFSAKGKLSYVRGKNSNSDDNLYNIMPLNARLAVEQRVSRWTNTVEAELVSDKSAVSATRNEIETAGYGLLHLRSSYQWKQLRVDVGVENLFDRLYASPLGGAYLGQGKTMTGNDVAWGTAVPGMGRSIYTGLNLKF